ncbi:hypothetical protein A9Q84_01155 [Halobacteriovorax marinus]|uniref:Putative DNA-binding domain-containing protein n=1 Tax=Halobacteriovorax marinus TaxID=97084 RepID=A0A1Y5FCB0_9BACT|nr:hypothetical protein A9Q84_01155 [Halobacteriovorax marinus]
MDSLKSILTNFTSDILNQEGETSSEVLKDTTSSNMKYYKNNYLYNHLDHLGNAYKAVKVILGEGNFQYFARLFLLSTPPKMTDMNQYGAGFSEFLGERAELENIQYLFQIARLDWFWFAQTEDEISIPQGIYQLWNAFLDGSDISEIEVDETIIEKISYQ